MVQESNLFKQKQEAEVSQDPLGDVLSMIKEKNKVLGYSSDEDSDGSDDSDEWDEDNSDEE